MDKLDKEVVEALSEPAKRIFRSLDSNSQKRLLKKARELAGQKDSRDRQKERVVRKKQAGKRETRKKNIEKRSGGISGNRRDAAFSAPGMAQGTKDTMATALHIMLMSGDGNSNDEGVLGELGRIYQVFESFVPEYLQEGDNPAMLRILQDRALKPEERAKQLFGI